MRERYLYSCRDEGNGMGLTLPSSPTPEFIRYFVRNSSPRVIDATNEKITILRAITDMSTERNAFEYPPGAQIASSLAARGICAKYN